MTVEVLRGRYELVEIVGRGGQGEVWRGRDQVHERTVAVKIRHVESNTERDRLLSEARILFSLDPHPNLPLVREDFFLGDRYFLVMDWIDGRNLDTVLNEDGDPGLPFDRVLRIAENVGAALDHLHRHKPSIVHQDVKPANIILDGDGRATLVDLGIASNCSGHTEHGGTPGFMAPELAWGLPTTAATDVFGLAAVVFTILNGMPPRPGTAVEWPGLTPDESATVQAVLTTALATDPERRPLSAGALVTALQSIDARAPLPNRRRHGSMRRMAGVAGVAMLAFGVTIACATTASYPHEVDNPPRWPTAQRAAPTTTTARPTARGEIDTTPPSAIPRSPGRTAPQPVLATAHGPAPAIRTPTPGYFRYELDGFDQLDSPKADPQKISGSQLLAVSNGGHPGEFDYAITYRASHKEQWTLQYGPDGVAMSAEAIDMTLNEANVTSKEIGVRPHQLNSAVVYRAPFRLVPLPLTYGSTFGDATNATVATQQATVNHKDDSRGVVVGPERITAGDNKYDTIKIELHTDLVGALRGTRDRTLWFSPSLGLLVKWEETRHLTWSEGAGATTTQTTATTKITATLKQG